MDTLKKQVRSKVMSRIRSKNTKLELLFRNNLWKDGFRYQKNNIKYFGRPDLLFKNKKLVIFLDSCFWHGCKKHLRLPKSNVIYWRNKIISNIKRDKEVNKYYKRLKWNIFRFWEHDLNSYEKLHKCIIKMEIYISNMNLNN
jgi:DNA mismatch endonuclease, patch repair protein